ncbi:MAG: hypothetical protein JXR46_14045 [Calditrichaceae bacterium]|nr:hypothetical protein [Calditrichaceae bacterium]MBN2710159.1 hypothetical protein [Calditrichaceae bacterium]RQV95812.1 MAG: hypothetical protein EH224_06465 [Calditrichota bacterium]
MRLFYISGIFLLSLFFISCNKGLEPPHNLTGISGTIHFTNWNSAGTIHNLKLVVFRTFPPEDIVSEVMSGEAQAYPPDLTQSLPVDVDSVAFTMELGSGYYAYITVAQQYGSNVYEDWRAVGQYDTTAEDNLPTGVQVNEGSILEGINIYVDFENPPPQPF